MKSKATIAVVIICLMLLLNRINSKREIPSLVLKRMPSTLPLQHIYPNFNNDAFASELISPKKTLRIN